MKVRSRILCLLSVVALSGCHKQGKPAFELNTNTQALAPYARNAVEAELEAGFGTPSDFVVWPQLPVDFGTFSGEVGRVLQSGDDGSIVLAGDGLTSSSEFSFSSRLGSLRGAAVVIVPSVSLQKSESEDSLPEEGSSTDEAAAPVEPVVLRVGSYDPETKTLEIVDAKGGPARITAAKGDSVQVVGDTLQFGRDLYHRHCVHCHGSSGDGDGPTAEYFNVKPRDYRKGIFKFTSTKAAVRASRDDLFRLVKLGVPGTYMPSFMLLPDDEVAAIVEYIRWLSMRGEMEGKLYVELYLDHSKADPVGEEQFTADWADGGAEIVETAGEELNDDWSLAEDESEVYLPPVKRTVSTQESISRGHKLFLTKEAACFSCHGEAARGNGPSTEIINKIKLPNGKEEDAAEPGLFDIWGNQVKPRDLTRGIYRGGRRPVDIYRRIYVGIKGTPMPGAGNKLKPEEIWDLVNYVLSLPANN